MALKSCRFSSKNESSIIKNLENGAKEMVKDSLDVINKQHEQDIIKICYNRLT